MAVSAAGAQLDYTVYTVVQADKWMPFLAAPYQQVDHVSPQRVPGSSPAPRHGPRRLFGIAATAAVFVSINCRRCKQFVDKKRGKGSFPLTVTVHPLLKRYSNYLTAPPLPWLWSRRVAPCDRVRSWSDHLNN